MRKKIILKLDELDKDLVLIEQTISSNYYEGEVWSRELNKKQYLEWYFKLENLISIIAKDSQYMENCKTITNNVEDLVDRFEAHSSLFKALKGDYENGYLDSSEAIIQADVFDTELEQANELLKSKYKLASAVIAGVVLETALRKICDRESIEYGKLDKMNSDLAKAGIYNKLQQKRITALADIRNSAAHGKDGEFTEDDVGTMIRDIESFLSKYL